MMGGIEFNFFSEGIEEYDIKGKGFKMFIEQLSKDCQLAGLDFKFSGAREDVLWELKNQLNEIVNNGASESKISNLLYRIDIPENKLDEILRETDVEMDHLTALTEVIAGRILQKIIMRVQYSNY